MLSVEHVIEALRPVEDPELHRSIVELNMVRDVQVDGDHVSLTIALTVPGCPLKAEIDNRVKTALTAAGATEVTLTFGVMTDEERGEVSRSLQSPQEGETRPNPFTNNRTRIIAVSSGKGGVGKSSVTTNLAVALAQRGFKVAAIDADVWGFSMPRMLGVEHPPTVLDGVILPPEAHGVRLISMGFFAREDQPVMWRGPMLHKAIEQFLTDVHWDDPDYLIIDMPPGTGDVSLSMAQFLPRSEVLVVTTPQLAAQRVAQRAALMAQKVNMEVIGVIENMSWFRGDDGTAYEIFGSGGGQDLADQLEVPLLGKIPLVPALREGGDDGHPIVVSEPNSEAAETFRAIADQIIATKPRKVFHPELKIS
ncbi:MAG: Mrp/NBP35 family ATP-binding protein [Acidimicrobiia bacterium]